MSEQYRGFTLSKEQCRQVGYPMQNKLGVPVAAKGRKLTQWALEDSEGYVRYFDTKSQAKAWVDSYEGSEESPT